MATLSPTFNIAFDRCIINAFAGSQSIRIYKVDRQKDKKAGTDRSAAYSESRKK